MTEYNAISKAKADAMIEHYASLGLIPVVLQLFTTGALLNILGLNGQT